MTLSDLWPTFQGYDNTQRLIARLIVSRVCVEEIHSVATINNVETSYFTQLKMCYLMTTFRCPSDSDVLITSWLFTAWWSTWPGNHLVPCAAELVGSCIPIHARRCLPDPKCLFYAGETGRKFGLRIKEHKKEVDSFTAGTQTRLGQGKSGRQRGTATDQMDKRGTLDQEDIQDVRRTSKRCH